ncbi:MAG: DUF2125 domain-containing protein, partial [Rubellimicrobium sp.]|nr:DUF2125 domain-containing protein [Rubellimicrobium sp.]
MIISRLGTSAVSVVAILSAQAALADLSAQDVWESWKDNLSMAVGDDLAVGGEVFAGDVLTVSDIVVTSDTGTEVVVVTINSMTFTEQGDGSVSVNMSEEIPIVVTSLLWDGSESVVNMAVRHQGLDITVSGSPEVQTYALSADRYAISLDEVIEEGNESEASGSAVFNDLSMVYTLVYGDLQGIEFEMSAGSLDLLFNLVDPWSELSVDIAGQVQDIVADFVALVPMDPELEPEDMFANGLAFSGGYSFGGTGYFANVSEWGMETIVALTVDSGETEFAIDADALGYSAVSFGIAVEVEGDMMPMPVSATLGEYGAAFFMPLAASEEPAEFGFGLTLADLVVSDDLWGMVDPMGVFSRDPATFILDLTGTAQLFVGISDPDELMMMGMMGDVPGELVSLSLNDLVVAIGGAQLSGNGAFTFDNEDYATFGGFPRPEGALTLQVNGANRLLDSLDAMGMLPPEELMGARMMLGLFTV